MCRCWTRLLRRSKSCRRSRRNPLSFPKCLGLTDCLCIVHGSHRFVVNGWKPGTHRVLPFRGEKFRDAFLDDAKTKLSTITKSRRKLQDAVDATKASLFLNLGRSLSSPQSSESHRLWVACSWLVQCTSLLELIVTTHLKMLVASLVFGLGILRC